MKRRSFCCRRSLERTQASTTLVPLRISEDQAIVPIWSRGQVLAAGDPRQFRAFARSSEFQFDAERQTGYFAIFNGGNDQ